MSVVAFPFKDEDPALVAANLRTAARHPAVDRVWAIAASGGGSTDGVADAAEQVWKAESTPVLVMRQQRLGGLRPGKGDGMNTAIREAAEAGVDRLHFYDADISNFDASWIDGAERAADRGFAVVRHRFPRSSTDAMITWMITRPSLAMIFPDSVLPRIGQPLGGEMLITEPVVRELASNPDVIRRSDWGIDTVITHATAALGYPMYEHNIPGGKRHTLYGSLEELEDMVVECLDAVCSLQGLIPPPDLVFEADPPAPVPEDLKKVIAYDIDRTIPLLAREWSAAERDLARGLPAGATALLASGPKPEYESKEADLWGEVLWHLLGNFDLTDPSWRSLAFRLWLTRVLSYTSRQVPLGYDEAIAYLETTIAEYEARAAAGDF